MSENVKYLKGRHLVTDLPLPCYSISLRKSRNHVFSTHQYGIFCSLYLAQVQQITWVNENLVSSLCKNPPALQLLFHLHFQQVTMVPSSLTKLKHQQRTSKDILSHHLLQTVFSIAVYDICISIT